MILGLLEWCRHIMSHMVADMVMEGKWEIEGNKMIIGDLWRLERE